MTLMIMSDGINNNYDPSARELRALLWLNEMLPHLFSRFGHRLCIQSGHTKPLSRRLAISLIGLGVLLVDRRDRPQELCRVARAIVRIIRKYPTKDICDLPELIGEAYDDVFIPGSFFTFGLNLIEIGLRALHIRRTSEAVAVLADARRSWPRGAADKHLREILHVETGCRRSASSKLQQNRWRLAVSNMEELGLCARSALGSHGRISRLSLMLDGESHGRSSH
jgi:hypothetical protein